MPGLGATGGSKLQVSYGWHYSNSTQSYNKHHVNETFDKAWQPRERQSIMDVTARYAFTRRFSLTATLPIINDQFSTLLPPNGAFKGERYTWNTNNIGDVSLFGSSWLADPVTHLFGNVSAGVGIKIPTGNWNSQAFIPNETGKGASSRTVWPPSIMTGDGGTAIILGTSGFKTLRKPVWLRGDTLFFSASYLINPRDTNGAPSVIQSLGVPLAPQFLTELTNSVTDSWNTQVGMSLKIPRTWDKPKLKGLRGRVAFDWEGIPRHDLFGASQGFRQPGYVLAVAPGATYAHGHGYFIAEVPITYNAYIDPVATAIPGLPTKGPNGQLIPAPFNPRRNIGMIAPLAVTIRYVRTF